jgi:hypothetical protein
VRKTALTDKDLLVLLTYAPAGLGHLRVLDALYDGLPEEIEPVLLGSRDERIRRIHRLLSSRPAIRTIFEWFQTGPLSGATNELYRKLLRSNTSLVYEQINAVIDQRKNPPSKLLVVATHFGLAHQLAKVKDEIVADKKVDIFLVVVVTDATFQPIWYVDGADLLTVPAEAVARQFEKHGWRKGREIGQIIVLPYPISPNLGVYLPSGEMDSRISQVKPDGDTEISVSIPVSGAAVGLGFFGELIDILHQKNDRFFFHVVSKEAPYTQEFLTKLTGPVEKYVEMTDREVVDAYETMLQEQVIALEVTKPSEQAFKALLKPAVRGGLILLLSKPFGKQEWDNLEFLESHGLIPEAELNKELWQMGDLDEATVKKACNWRGLRIPDQAGRAAEFIIWCLEKGIFSQMAAPVEPRKNWPHPEELGREGVLMFWEKIAELI